MNLSIQIFVTQSIAVYQKKRGRGRPATGRDPLLSARVPDAVRERVDRYAAERGITRSEAVRELLETALDLRPSGAMLAR
ncbi:MULTISPECIES: ribbon-helix-helix protein, CopG family [Rhodoplanes]|uniref:ribbon-helix-helix protein, CopG family n=1 Tax=Rhodoplanes TaxID=29407 RepID=UPI00353166BE